MKKLILIFIIVSVLFGLYYFQTKKKTQITVTTFEECKAAGFPIAESYPSTCRDNSGNTFVEEIGNELEMSDLILVDSPRPNQVVTSPLIISGKARGAWYFEASAPVFLYNSENVILSQGYLKAYGEWMTEQFVEFKGKLEFEVGNAVDGYMVFENANPSGMSENSKKLIMPVKFR